MTHYLIPSQPVFARSLYFNAACLAEKQQIVFGLNLRSTALEASTLTITPPMRLILVFSIGPTSEHLLSRHNNVESTLKIGCYVEQPKFNVTISTLNLQRWIYVDIMLWEQRWKQQRCFNVENSTFSVQRGWTIKKGGGDIWNSRVRPF
jgi:hypothetical protein